MRSELVTQAVVPVRNRFVLVHVASVITRKFHRPSKERVQDSINNALAGIGEGRYLLKHFLRPDRSTASVEVYGSTVTPEQTPVASGEFKPVPDWVWEVDEPTPEERMAVCSALLNVADEVVETA